MNRMKLLFLRNATMMKQNKVPMSVDQEEWEEYGSEPSLLADKVSYRRDRSEKAERVLGTREPLLSPRRNPSYYTTTPWHNFNLTVPFVRTLWKLKNLGEYLTRIEWEKFQNINPTELIDDTWKSTPSSMLWKLANRFNTISLWVSTVILCGSGSKGQVLKSFCEAAHFTLVLQAQVIRQFIEVAQELYDLRNVNCMASVYLGLTHGIKEPLFTIFNYVLCLKGAFRD